MKGSGHVGLTCCWEGALSKHFNFGRLAFSEGKKGQSSLILLGTAARLANHQTTVQGDFSDGQIRIVQALEHRRHRNFADVLTGLTLGGKRDGQKAGVFNIIDAYDADLFRYLNPQGQSESSSELPQCGHWHTKMRRGDVS